MQATIRATTADRFPEVARFHQLKEAGAFSSPAYVAEKLLELAFGDLAQAPVRLRVPDEPPGQRAH